MSEQLVDPSEMGQILKGLRLAADMTQGEVAVGSGIGRVSIANIEGGRQSITIKQLNQLAYAMGYDVYLSFKRRGE